MKLAIYALEKTLFEGEVESLTLPTATGEITVLDDHVPLISLVNSGEVRYTHSGTQKITNISGGVIEVRLGSEVVILTGGERR